MAKKLTKSKAKEILHDKSVHGHPLTDKQRRFFGAIAGGAKPYKAQIGTMLTGFHPNLAENLSEVLSAPQKAATQLVTGKYQTPSEAMGIQNAAGAFLTDVVLDPLGLLGIGAAKKMGALDNAWKINPWRFKPDPEAGYRMIGGKEGLLDAIRSGEIRPTSQYEHAHFNIGQPLNPKRLSAEELIKAGSPGGYKGPYMAEMKQGVWQRMTDAFSDNPEMQEQLRLLGKDKDVWQHPFLGNIKVDDPRLKLYKEHWLKGYKQVKPPKKKQDGGWLDKYVPKAQNGIEGTMGGLTDKGFNYNGAWGGPSMQMGGNIMPAMAGANQTVPMAQLGDSVKPIPMQLAMGGSLPGAVGFTYARVSGAAPANGPYAKKTKASAQNGQEMKFYQAGLDFTPKTISRNGGWLDKFDDEVPQAQTGFLTQRYSTGPMMGDLATQSGVPTQAEVARQDQLRKEVEAAKQKKAARARYEAMPKIGPAKQRNYSEQVAAEEQRRRLNQQYADQNPEVTVDDFGDIVPSGYGRFMQTYGSNLDKFARSLETPLAIEGALSLAPLVGRGAVAAGEYFTTQTPVRNAYKLNPASGKIPMVGEKPNWLRGYSKDYTDPTKIDFSGMSRFSDPISKSNINKLNQLDNEWRALSQAERDIPEIFNQYHQAKQKLLIGSKLQNTGLGKLFNVDDVIGAGSYSEFVSPLKYSPDVVLKYSTKEPFEGATRSLFEAGKSIRDPQIGLPFHLQELGVNKNVTLTPRMQGSTFGLAQRSAEPISRTAAAEIALKLRQLNKQEIYPDWQGYNFLRNPETGAVSVIDLNTLPGSGAAEAFVEGSRVGQNPATIIKQNWNLQPKQRKGGVIKDNQGYWNPQNWGKVVEIDSNDITMKGVNQPLIGVSDEGDVKYMEPGKDYKFKGKKVKEYPVAKKGISVNNADAQPLKKLDQLLNFTNYNKPTKGGWLDKYN